MRLITSELKLMSIRSFLQKYRTLIFWLVWGVSIGLMFGFMKHDFQTYFTIFMGFGIYLGLTLQFVRIKWLRRVALFVCVVIVIILIWKPAISFVQRTLNMKISRSFLIDDVRQLASLLEVTHPDPYYRGGGKIAFHRRMQEVILTPAGETLTALFMPHLMKEFKWVEGYQVSQDSKDSMCVHVVTGQELSESLTRPVAEALNAKYGEELAVTFERVDKLRKTASGKTPIAVRSEQRIA